MERKEARGFWAVWGRGLRNAGLHLGFALQFSLLDVIFDLGLWRLLGVAQREGLVASYFAQLFHNSYSYVAVVAVAHAARYYRLYHEQHMRTARLESQLLQAQLQALQMQLRPHFLFNTLHTVAGLIRTGEHQTAIRMLAGLGDLLRAVLRSEGQQEVSLGEELGFAERYLRLQQLRFEDGRGASRAALHAAA